MRVARVDGLVTLFYDSSKELFNRELNDEVWDEFNRNRDKNDEVKGIESYHWEEWDISDECKRYKRERLSWQQIIVVDGVTEIPECTFAGCLNIKRVIFANTVIRIRDCAFFGCKRLVFIKWAIRLEYIGEAAYEKCNLSSVFVPPTCRHIAKEAFANNKNLSLLNIPQDAELGNQIITGTALAKASPILTVDGQYIILHNGDINQWLKNINNDENLALHRACASYNPLKQVIQTIVQDKGLKAFREENSIGITPSRYLKENPHTDLTEKEIIHDYLMKVMGEVE